MTDSSEEDRRIIQRVRDGEIDAFAALVRKYQVRVRGYCTRTLRSTALGDDAAQDIFLKAYQGLGRFRGDAAFSSWLFRIMVNQCRDVLRSAAMRRTESWDAMVEQHSDAAEALASTTDDTLQRLEQAEQLQRLLSHLTDVHREILLLREAQGLTYEELAATLHCTVDAVKGRLKRARQELLRAARHAAAGPDVQTDRGA
jgi:RNA polymerase sigma-70 factor (ECF subfamily)